METQLELSNGWVYKGTAEPEDLVPSVEEDKDDAAASGSSSGVSFPAPVPHVKAVPIGSSDPHVAHGFGTLHDASGRTLAEGTWESGWFSGGGKTFFMPADAHPESDPEMVSEGEFKKGVLSEGWRLDETLEKKLEGSFDRKGILQGPRAKLSYVRGPKLGDEIEGEVLNGELCGRVMYKYATGELYEGLMMGGQRNGYGKQHQNTGELLGAGLWVNDQLTSTEPVPTACLLQGKNVPQNIFSVATLLYQNGCYYKGAVAERKGKIIPHGEAPNNEGFIHAPNGAVLLRARWKDGQVVERLAGPIDRITPGTDEIYAARDGFYVGQLTSATLVQSYQALAALGMGMQIAGAASASASNPALARATTRVPHGVCRRYGITGEAESEGRFVAGKLVNGWHLNKAGLYDGEWADGTRNGFGKYTYLEGMHKGDIYEGEWRRNIRVGLGVRTAANGEVYDGQWNGNLKKGWGIEWSRMGKVKHMGMWNNLFTQPEQPVPRAAIIGKKFLPPMVQSASLIYPNLNFFVGPLETAPLGHRAALGKEGGNMVPHGVGKMYNAQGLLLAEGNWDMGQQVSGAQTSAQDLARAAASMPAQSPATSSSASSRDDGPSASEFEAPVVIPEFSAEEEARMERRAEMHERFDNLMAKTASKLAQGGTVTPATTVVSPTHVAQSARVVSAAQSLAEKKAALAQRQAQLARVHQAQQGPVTLGAPMYGQPQYVQPQPVMMAPPVPQPVVMAPPPPPGVQIPQFSTVKQLMDALNYLLSNNRNVIARIETALFSMYGAANAQYMYHGAWCCAALSAKPSLVAALLHRTQPLDPRQMLQMFPPGCRIDPDPPVAMQQQQQPMQLQQAQMQMQQPQILQPQQQPLQQQQQQQQPLSPHPPGGPQSPLSSQQSQPAFAQPQPVHPPQPQIVSAPPQAVHSPPPPPVAAAPSPVPASAPAVVSPRTVAPVTPAPAVHAPIVAAAAGPGQKLHGGFVKKKSHSNRHNWNKRTLELYQRQLQYNDPAAPASHPKSKWTILPLSEVSDCSVAKKGVGKGSDKGVRFNLLLKDKRAYEFITELAAEAQGWNNRINQAMIDLKTLPPQSAAVQPLHVSSSSALASKEEPADKSILPSVPTITAISDSKTDKFVSQVASNGKKIEKAHEQVLSASENISKVAEAFSSNSSEIAKHSALGAEIIGHVGSVAQGLSSMVSKVFPPFAIVFDLITLITKKASEAKTNQSNCRYLADRCEALRGVLMSVRDHWATVEARSQATPPTPESQLALTQLQAVLPLFQKVVDELQNAADLLSEYSGMSTFRKFVSSASIQSRFEECDANISKVVADLTFGLSADAATKAGEVLQNLQSSMPYLSEKVDQVLSEMMSGNEAANARDERIQQRLEQLKADHTDVSSALASSRGHLASMKRLGLKQQAQTDAANKRVEEMASMLQQLLLAQQQSQAARANDPVSSTASTASSSSVATSSTGATSPQSSVSDSSSSSNSSSGHSSSHSSFNFNSAFEIAPDEIELESEAGRGSFGVVYRARYRGQRVAVKKLLLTSEVSAEELRSEFQREVQALCSIRHNRLILAYGACTSVEDPFIVTEWLERGSLFDCIHPSPAILAKGGDHNRPPRSALLPLCVQILEGITYLHMSRPPVIHRDIKTANVLIDENFNARISDFGFAKSFGTGSQASIMSSGQSNAGTVAYQAPELLTMTSSATPASDMYAVGVLLFEIFTGDVPWKGKQLFEIVMLVGVQQKSLMQCNDQATIDKIPAGIQAIITALFREASLRPNASEVLQMLLKEVAREKSAASASSK